MMCKEVDNIKIKALIKKILNLKAIIILKKYVLNLNKLNERTIIFSFR